MTATDRETVKCRICGREFQTRTPWDTVCSEDCRREAELAAYYQKRQAGYKPETAVQIADWDWQTEKIRIEMQTKNAVADAYSEYRRQLDAIDSKWRRLRQAELTRHRATMNGYHSGAATEKYKAFADYKQTKKAISDRRLVRRLETFERCYKGTSDEAMKSAEYKKLRRDVTARKAYRKREEKEHERRLEL